MMAAAVAGAFMVPQANAAPIAATAGLNAATAAIADAQVQTVQWRRGWGRGWGWGPGIVAGAIVGGAIAASRPWGYGYYDNPGYYYDDYAYDQDYAYAPGYTYAPGYSYAPGYARAPGYVAAPTYGSGDDVAYCQQRFRSYDMASGTYMGYDGRRHSCP
jgi:hypothetical protein